MQKEETVLMELKHGAVAGTLESSDIMITIHPGTDGVKIDLTSSVAAYYGDSIRAMIQKVLAEMGVENAVVKAVDHGALDCTIRARTTTAVRRAVKKEAVQ